MKYLKLFEGFKSTILSKSLNQLENYSKNKFLDDLKYIVGAFDIPISELNNDVFKYLPYDEAFDLVKDVKLRDSETNKKIVDCDYIKFWFTRNGEYVGGTYTDGSVSFLDLKRPGHLSKITDINTKKYSKNIDDYDVVKIIEPDEIRTLETGTIVQIELATMTRTCRVVGVLYKENNYSSYIIQDELLGSNPRGQDWKEYGEYAWYVGVTTKGQPAGFVGEISILKRKNDDKRPNYNFPFEFPETEKPVSWITPSDRTIIKNPELSFTRADWAVIIDCDKLKELDVEKEMSKRERRINLKKDAQAFNTDDVIRYRNLERYIQKIVNSLESSMETRDFRKIIMKFIGGNFLGVHICEWERAFVWNNFTAFVKLLGEYLFIMEYEDDEKKAEEIKQSIIGKIKTATYTTFYLNKEILSTISTLRLMYPKSSLYLNKVLEMNKLLFDVFNNMEIETYGDLMIMESKMKLVREYQNKLFTGPVSGAIFNLVGFTTKCKQNYEIINRYLISKEVDEQLLRDNFREDIQSSRSASLAYERLNYLKNLDKSLQSFEKFIKKM